MSLSAGTAGPDCNALKTAFNNTKLPFDVTKCCNTVSAANAAWGGYVICDQQGHITKLNLSSLALDGSIPDVFNQFPNLITLDLSFNNFSAGLLPNTFFTPPSLKFVNVSSNMLSGNLPMRVIGNYSLTELNIANNKFVGEVPADWSMPSLQVLNFSNNNFTGNLPVYSSLPMLTTLDLSSNYFSGPVTLEFLMQAVYLDKISVANNLLGGTIPKELNARSFSYLDFGFNNFTGPLPDIFDFLPGLEFFDVSYNQLSGKLPETVALAQPIKTLNLRSNLFTNYIPDLFLLINMENYNFSDNCFDNPSPLFRNLSFINNCARVNKGVQSLPPDVMYLHGYHFESVVQRPAPPSTITGSGGSPGSDGGGTSTGVIIGAVAGVLVVVIVVVVAIVVIKRRKNGVGSDGAKAAAGESADDFLHP